MIIAACVDDAMGMMFNGRRQSRDRYLMAHLEKKASGRTLRIAPGSAELFDAATSVWADEDFLQRAGQGDVCFVENADFAAYISEVEEIWLYRWNRIYPSDVYFPVPLEQQGWRCIGQHDFSGYSHACITEEIYKR